MTRATQQDAFAALRMLRDVNAGRLRGQALAHRYAAPVSPGTLDEQAAAVLAASVYRAPCAPVPATGIVYVASCDGTPVAWVTRDAAVVLPTAVLTDYQRRQQARAAAALGGLSRHAIRALAKLADEHGARPDGGTGEPDGEDNQPYVLAADPATPTRTYWTRLGADPVAAAEHLRQITGARDDVLIVAASGYGAYGMRADVLEVPVLCAIEQIAHTAGVPLHVVSDWLDAEGGSRRRVPAERITEAFRDSFCGVYTGQQAYAVAERDARGWTAVLETAGIPTDLFDLHAFAMRLFTDHVYEVRLTGRRIAVFRRAGAEVSR